jgi:1D-myo-inositol-tetrakisphosphate 5-kinase/inositol-polyphosphate multikinase
MSTPAVQALASQVGGHAGVMTTEDGSLLIKPALKRELEFYQRLQTDEDEAIATLRKFTPRFLGTLTLEGEAKEGSSEGGALEIKPAAERKDEFLVYWLVPFYCEAYRISINTVPCAGELIPPVLQA